ncbi:MAG: hypothetical protein MJZ75_03510 [Paludibacteraceae bacterium]|nr:hypothetical protein [Paludibacteraceae bacterium]
MELNHYEQQLVDTFIAIIPQIITNDVLIDFEQVQRACAQHLLCAAYKTKSNPRTWVCETFGVSKKWLLRKNI